MDLPWWALSPSPFSIAFYLLLAFYGMKKLMPQVTYKRFKHLTAFADVFFILGLVVLFGDLSWIVASGLRFGQIFPDSVLQLVFSAIRNVVGLILCWFLVGGYFKHKILEVTEYTIFLVLANWFFITFWFGFAPNPAWTDWTFALRYNYPLSTVLSSFLISHVIGKSLVAATYYTLWR